MAKILVTETIDTVGTQLLLDAGHQVILANRNEEIIKKEILDADGVIVRIWEMTEALISTGKNLKMISKHGVGVDNIDLDYCKSQNIIVTITPNANSLSVAEHAFALMIALAKNLVPVSKEYREVGFSAKNYPAGMELGGKTVGIIGIGAIGSLFVPMCREGMGMNVIGYDPYISPPAGVTMMSDLELLLKESDIISLHCSLNDETKKMINKDRIAKMKSGALLINCARGPIVEEQALIEALKIGKIGGAGLDVTDPEPISPESPLLQMPNVIVTPHYAPTTKESATRVSKIAGENMLAVLSDKEPVGKII